MLILYKKKQSITMGANLWDKEKTKQTNPERFSTKSDWCLEQINLL